VRHGSGGWPTCSGRQLAAAALCWSALRSWSGTAAKKSVHHTTQGLASGSWDGSPWGQLPRRFPAVESTLASLGPPTVRAAGPSRPRSQVARSRFTRPCDGRPAHDDGCSAGSSRVGHYATFAHAGSWPCRPVRFCPRAHGALAPGTVPLAGVGQKIPTQQNAPKQRVLCEEQSFTRCAHAL
jgi:hypothetical protein